jgi:hypothetical protein
MYRKTRVERGFVLRYVSEDTCWARVCVALCIGGHVLSAGLCCVMYRRTRVERGFVLCYVSEDTC